MEQRTTFSKSDTYGDCNALMSTMTIGSEYDFREMSLQFIHTPSNTTVPNWVASNGPAYLTVGSQFIVLQRIDNYEDYRFCTEDTAGPNLSSGYFFDRLSGEIVETCAHNKYDFSDLFYRSLRSLEIKFIAEPFLRSDNFCLSPQVIQERQETIRADTDRAMSFGELLNALDRISRPVEMEEVPLSVDPDDYPVV